NKSAFSAINIPIPSREYQDSIAAILKTIDKKIELNNKINAELEAMAKLMYDYWFVQFDFPDAIGKPYKSSGGKMVYNKELKREIPEGWILKAITEEMDVQYGYPFSTKLFNE
ncbi:restriction endonuclease subunit S, partial [Brevibacterium sp. SIMBA_078]|uniref:restriction endonuclease subunit S n=1 Tax=Brevibacterium sp. SIMBA_078 TaxID=3085816 RepID=UPI00397E642A